MVAGPRLPLSVCWVHSFTARPVLRLHTILISANAFAVPKPLSPPLSAHSHTAVVFPLSFTLRCLLSLLDLKLYFQEVSLLSAEVSSEWCYYSPGIEGHHQGWLDRILFPQVPGTAEGQQCLLPTPTMTPVLGCILPASLSL